jgi:hypothetical protein
MSVTRATLAEQQQAQARQQELKFTLILKRVARAAPAAPAAPVSSRADDGDNNGNDDNDNSAIAIGQKTTFESLVSRREKEIFKNPTAFSAWPQCGALQSLNHCDLTPFHEKVIDADKLVRRLAQLRVLEADVLGTTNELNDLKAAVRKLEATVNRLEDEAADMKRRLQIAEEAVASEVDSEGVRTAKDDVRKANHRVDMANDDVRTAKDDVRKANDRVDKANDRLTEAEDVESVQSCVETAVCKIDQLITRLLDDIERANHHRSSLLSQFRLKDKTSYEYLHAIVAVEMFEQPEADWNAFEKCAACLHVFVLHKLRDSDVARCVRGALQQALSAPGSALTERSLATADGLLSVASRLGRGPPYTKNMCFVASALCELATRFTRAPQLLNESTVRLHNNKVLTNAFDGASLEVEHSTVAEDHAAVARNTSDAAVRHDASRIHDEVVFAQGEIVLRGETVMPDQSDRKKAGDRNRLIYATFKQWSALRSIGDRYSFGLFATEFRLEMWLLLPLYWRVTLKVPIFDIDLATPGQHDYGRLFDYLCDVVAINHVMQSSTWNLGLGPTASLDPDSEIGKKGRDDGDDNDDGGFGRCARGRARMQQNGRFAEAAQSAAPLGTPSVHSGAAKQQQHSVLMCRLLGGCQLSQKEWSDSHSVVSVFVVDGGAKVLKLLAANDAATAREAARELFVHTLLTRNAPAAIVPLVAATSAEWIADDFVARHLGLRACDAVTVLEMACADADGPNWASLDGVSLSTRGEQLLAALAALAAAGVVHGDVKPLNIVVHEGTVRVIDFGVSAVLDLSGRSERVPARGTRWFMAPEVAASEDGWTTLTPAVDVFGAGRVLSLAESAMRSCAPLRALVERMTVVDAGDRPTMAEALREWRSSVAAALCPPPPQKQAPLSAANPNRLPRAPTVTLLKEARARQSVGVENENDAARLVTHRTQH